MNIVRFRQQTATLWHVFISLSLLAMNFGVVASAEAMTTQAEITQIVETNEPPQILEGDQIGVTMSMNGYPQPFMLSLHATDANSDPLTWQISVPAQNGTVSVSGSGTTTGVDYSPKLDFTGMDSFVVEVSDGHAGTDSIVVNVTITPTPEVQTQEVVTPTPEEPDIVGGAPADPGEYPWQVALVDGTSNDLYGTQFCGGSLIASQWVLTAAHCITEPNGSISPVSSLDVVAGIYNLATPAAGYQRRDVIQIIRHPSYSAATYDNDLALLKLNTPVILGGSGETKTALIPLVPANIGNLTGVNAWVTGWGNTESVPAYPTQLYEVQVPIIANSVCNDATHYSGDITANMLCAGYDAGGYDSCQGDSGGPMVVSNSGQWNLAGIVSWGEGCADPFRPGVYTRVSQYSSWINSNVSTPHCGTISNETWSGAGTVHTVTCDVTVPAGATLTIEPGAIVKFYPNTRLTINGKLIVQGNSPSADVVLTSYIDDDYGGDTNQNGYSTCSPGNWRGVFFGDTSDDTSLIDNALIRCGGSGWDGYGGINFDNASPTIQNSTFRQNAYCAMVADLHSFPTVAGNTYLNNDANALCLLPQAAETIDANSIWKPIDTSYYVRNNVTVTLGNTLTINPGVVVKVSANARLTINGGLQVGDMNGAQVVLTSYRDDENGIGANKDTNGDGASACSPDDWDGIFFGDTSDGTSVIDHALIRCGGNGWDGYGGINFDNASPTIQNSTFRQNGYCAVVADLHSFPTLAGNTYLNNHANALCLLPQPTETIDTNSTWKPIDTSYYIRNNVTVTLGNTLTINPGVVVKVSANARLTINGGLSVPGSALAPVSLTSYRDDENGIGVNKDTNGDGATVCAPDDWDGIFFGDTSDDASLIAHALIRCGGNGWDGYGGVDFDNASPTIQNSTLRQNAYCAMVADLHSFPTLTGNTYLNNHANGLCLVPQAGEAIDADSTWKPIDTSYYVRNHVTVTLGNTLTISPGVVVKWGNNVSLNINGKFLVQGSAPAPVVLTSYRDDENGIGTNKDTDGGGASTCVPDDWEGIFFGDTSDDTSLIDHALIRCGGNGYWGWGSINFDAASPAVQNTTLTKNAFAGLVVNNLSSPALHNLTITYNARGISISNSSPTIQNSTISNNQDYGIYTSNSTPNLASCNNIQDNGYLSGGKRYYGLYNETPGVIVNADNQWWGSPSGPYHPTLNPGGTGNAVSDGVDFDPWAMQPCGSTPAAPEMDVKGNNVSILDGDSTPSLSDHTDFGSTPLSSGTVSRTFTIYNTGNANLILSGTPKVVVTGTHAADFTVTTQPSSPITPGGSTTFTVEFNPSAAGLRSAALSIANNDADENPYDFAIQGTGIKDLPASWVGGVTIASNRQVVTVGRPHIGSEVASYGGFASGSLTAYVPMLFKTAYGSYDSALYVQNVHASSTANITIKYYDSNGVLNCTKADTLAPLASKGYWVPSAACDTGSLPSGWVGGVVVTSNQPIVAVGRPHIGAEVMTYDGFASGSLTSYIPMLFKGAFGGAYNAAFYLQNTHASNTANVTIKYYDSNGVLNCTRADTIAPLASKGYWVPTAACDTGSLPNGWIGGVVVTSNQPIVAVGRPHIGSQVTTYTGFPAGSLSSYVPMLFKGAFGGSYNAAFYLQNTDASNTANITVKYYDSNGNLNCTKTDTIAALASKGYWVPTATCDTGSLPSGWVGGVVVTSDQPIVAVGRPHIEAQVTTYNGFTSGSPNAYLPMLFKGAFGGVYNAAFYVQNTENSAATVTIKFYDTIGNLSCTHTDSIPALSTLGFWVPSVTCDP